MRAFLTVAFTCFTLPALAGEPPPVISTGNVFEEQTGQALYASVCQACHMPNAQGAAGGGRYPALAANPKLAAAGYPVTMVLHGFNGMPALGKMMTDNQVAQVVNYVRTHFGNDYTDTVKPDDVKALR